MKRMLLAGAAIGLTVLGASACAQASRPWLDSTKSPDARADAAVAAMTRDEKLTLVFGLFGSPRPEKQYAPPAEAKPGSAGYVPGIARLGIPAQFETDAGLGVATQGSSAVKRERTSLPSGIATTASWDPVMAQAGGAMIGDEARRSGFNVMLAGGVNLAREPRNGRNFEYGGEDPLLAGTMVGAQIAGIQSNNIISTMKHYAINDQETDRDTGSSNIDPTAARMSDLLAFQFALERGSPGSVMCSYNRINGTHSCENRYYLTDVLRRDWNWPGYVMSDWGGAHSTVAAANAGLDQDSGYPFDKEPYFGAPLKAAVERGEVSEARLTQMTRRIVRSMAAHGVLDHPVSELPIDYAAHADITRRDAEAGAVLLKNDRALLPLSPTTRRIAVIGGHADRGVLAGGGSALVYPRGSNAVPGLKPTSWPGPVIYYPDAPLAAMRRLAPDAIIEFASGDDPVAAAALAKRSDVAIVFGTQWAGESFDVALSLDGAQDQTVAAITAANPRTVVVIESGGPVLTPWATSAGAILAAWYPGTQGGTAIANLLFGKVAPSGRLPVTFPRSLDQLPHPATPNVGETAYPEGATVGYKWYDAKGLDPQFPFGHGLTYTSFNYGGLTASPAAAGITASFRVTNTGRRAGAAVPQIYVGSTAPGWEAPKRLGGWQKIALDPGKSASVKLTVDPRLLATWDEAGRQWRIAGGTYQVMLGASSRDIAQTVSVTLARQTLPAGWRP